MSGMRWVPGKGVVWDSGIQERIFAHNDFTPDAVNYGFYGDGTEAGASLLPAAQDTTYAPDLSGGNFQIQLRVQIDETGTDTAATNQNYSLEYELNDSATWVPITTTSTAVQVDTGSSLTDGAATTDRLTGGAGTFGAGEVDGGSGATGTTGNLNVPTASNHTEIVWGLNLIASALANNDTIDFRVLADGATFAATMGQPRLTIIKGASVTPITLSATDTGVATIARKASFFRTLSATAVAAVNIVRMFFITLKPSSGVAVEAWTFGGTNEALTKSTLAAVDDNNLFVSLWFRRTTSGAGEYFLNVFGTSRLYLRMGSGDTVDFRFGSNTAGDLWTGSLTGITVTDTDWHHFAISCDSQSFTTTDDLYIMFDGSSASPTTASSAAGDIDLNRFSVIAAAGNNGGGVQASGHFNGDLAEVFIDTRTVDITQASEIAKFRDPATGCPVDLGSDGSTPFGAQPLHYLSNPAATVEINNGSAGNWTEVGTITDAATAPSDGCAAGVNVTMLLMQSRTLSATVVSAATVAFAVFFNRILSATVTGVATLLKNFSTVTLSAAQIGAATLNSLVVYFRTLPATHVGVATIARRLLALRTFSATATGVATQLKHFSTIAFSAVMTGVTTFLNSALVEFIFSATTTGVATISRGAFVFQQTLSATATNVATLLKHFSTIIFSAKTGSLAVRADFIRFDGIAGFVEWATGPSTAIDGRAATFAIPFNRKGGSGAECIFYDGTTTGESIFVGFNADDNLIARVSDGTSKRILEIASTTTYSDAIDRVAVFSFDLDGEAWLYVNETDVEPPALNAHAGSSVLSGVSPLFSVVFSATAEARPVKRAQLVEAANIDFTDTWRFGSTDDSSNRQWYSGASGHVYVELAYHDPADIGLFYSSEADGPRDHGPLGNEVTGVIPELYWAPTADNPLVNNGSGGNADTASTFSDVTDPPLLFVNPATMGVRGQYRRILSDALVGSATLNRFAAFFRTLSATVTGVATLLKNFSTVTFAATMTGSARLLRMLFVDFTATLIGVAELIVEELGGGFTLFTRTISTSMTGVATLLRRGQFFRTFSATATGVATLLRRWLAFRTFEATVTASASLVRTLFETLSATMTGVAALVKRGQFFRTFSATSTGLATIVRLVLFARILSATATGLATLLRRWLALRTLSATATMTATLVRLGLFFRTLSATATGAATFIRGAATTLFTVTISATMAGVATLQSLYQQFRRPFTGHGGLGMTDGPARWKRRKRTWSRRK